MGRCEHDRLETLGGQSVVGVMRASASRVGLLDFCGYWAQPGVTWDNETSYTASRGTAFHSLMAAYICGAPHATPSSVWMSRRYNAGRAWVDSMRRDGWEFIPEVAMAWQFGETRVLSFGGGRDYPDDLFCGTADLVGFHQGTRTLVVGDWKTGRCVTPKDWEQVHTLGAMVRHVAPWAERFDVRLLHAQDGGIVDRVEPCAPEKEEAKLIHRLLTIESAWPQAGEHCDSHYCPHKKHCHTYKQRIGT